MWPPISGAATWLCSSRMLLLPGKRPVGSAWTRTQSCRSSPHSAHAAQGAPSSRRAVQRRRATAASLYKVVLVRAGRAVCNLSAFEIERVRGDHLFVASDVIGRGAGC
jgi:hypothetical protein